MTSIIARVTTAPKSNHVRVPNNGYRVAPVMDSRIGEPVQVTDIGVLILQNNNWSDVETLGDKVFKVTPAGTL
jgi:hypothetical protein